MTSDKVVSASTYYFWVKMTKNTMDKIMKTQEKTYL